MSNFHSDFQIKLVTIRTIFSINLFNLLTCPLTYKFMSDIEVYTLIDNLQECVLLIITRLIKLLCDAIKDDDDAIGIALINCVLIVTVSR